MDFWTDRSNVPPYSRTSTVIRRLLKCAAVHVLAVLLLPRSSNLHLMPCLIQGMVQTLSKISFCLDQSLLSFAQYIPFAPYKSLYVVIDISSSQFNTSTSAFTNVQDVTCLIMWSKSSPWLGYVNACFNSTFLVLNVICASWYL